MSEHWSTVLLAEWANQASLEQELSLPVSVVASADAAIQAKGQIGFIDLFTLPLFDAAADAMPGEWILRFLLAPRYMLKSPSLHAQVCDTMLRPAGRTGPYGKIASMRSMLWQPPLHPRLSKRSRSDRRIPPHSKRDIETSSLSHSLDQCFKERLALPARQPAHHLHNRFIISPSTRPLSQIAIP